MRLVVLCGQPACGKSTIAATLSQSFQERGLQVEIVDEPSLGPSRREAYADVVSEKNTRGSLRSMLDRALAGRAQVIIFDSLNNIKGYRYELWCLARAAGVRYCMVHVDTPVDTCREWNRARPESEQYPDSIFEDLAGRFERPDGKNRWDAPLFTIKPTGSPEDSQEALTSVVCAMTDDLPREMGGAAAKDLQPTTATLSTTLQATNTLHEMDHAVQDVMERILEAQSTAGSMAPGRISLSHTQSQHNSNSQSGHIQGPGVAVGTEGPLWIQLDNPISVAELRRHKRAFLKLATKVTFARLHDAVTARNMFVDYLVEHIPGCLRSPKPVMSHG